MAGIVNWVFIVYIDIQTIILSNSVCEMTYVFTRNTDTQTLMRYSQQVLNY